MLVTIRNLPGNTRYADLKSLIVSKCGLSEMILDNLMPDGINTKKVTVGLAEEEDAAILMRKINGLLIEGHQVYVESIKKKQGPGAMNNESDVSRQPSLHQPYYQQSNYQPSNYQAGYADLQSYAGMYGVAAAQNAFANYGYPQQMQYQSNQMMAQSVATFDQSAPLGFSNQDNNSNVWANQNVWNPAGCASDGNRNSQQNRNSSRWDNSDDTGRSRGDAPARDRGREGQPRNYGRDAPARDYGRKATRDHGRDAPSHGFGRDAPSRDRGRDAPRSQRRDASYRERGGDVPARDRGRDAFPRNETGRDFSRNDLNRGPSKRPFPANNTYQRDKPGQNKNIQPKAAKGKSEYGPPAKRQRPGNFGDMKGSANNAQPQAINKKKIKKNDPESLINRATTWRCQIASAVAKEMLQNPDLEHDMDKPLFLTELKRAIRHRLDMLFGDDVIISQKDMVTLYRQKYSVDSDPDLFHQVAEDIKSHGVYVSEGIEQAEPKEDASALATAAIKKILPNVQGGKQKSTNGTGINAAAVNKEEEPKKIPSYPQGDKKLSKEWKKVNALIFQDIDALICQLEPNMQKVLQEEVDEMGAVLVEEFQDQPAKGYEGFHKRAKTVIIDECQQMVKVNFAKRVLGVQPIMLRIFNTPKIINRTKLANVLAEYGVDSLRKSDKKPPMYFGSCKTYEQHDKLIAMEPLVVDGSKVVIKPFHLTGFNEKVTKTQIKTQRQQMSERFNPPDSEMEAEEFNEEVDEEMNLLNAEEEDIQDQNDDDQPEYENQEPEDVTEENLVGDQLETAENGDSEETGKTLEGEITQETNENDNAEKAESKEPCTKGKDEEHTGLDKKNSIGEDASMEPEAMESKQNEEVDTPNSANCNITDTKLNDESQNKDNSHLNEGKPSESEKVDADKDVLKNSADGGRKNYDDIDIDDINDDDLEDW